MIVINLILIFKFPIKKYFALFLNIIDFIVFITLLFSLGIILFWIKIVFRSNEL